MQESNEKRLFFGAEIEAPWQNEPQASRIIEKASRHLTLAFLGKLSYSSLKEVLFSTPSPPFRIGIAGKCDKILFLPEKHPRVVAAHVEWLLQEGLLKSYRENLLVWLQEKQLPFERGPFLSHITLARTPFAAREWSDLFMQIPLFVKGIHLYESLGHLTYRPVWSHPLLSPFEELDHTADIAFRVLGETMDQLHLHAQLALCFHFPPLLSHLSRNPLRSLEDLIISLNEVIGKVDEAMGCPFKAVSFHGEVIECKNQLLQWEMIVDV